jgi:hypothetical protein
MRRGGPVEARPRGPENQQVLLTLIAGMAPLVVLILMIRSSFGVLVTRGYLSTTPYFLLIERRLGKSFEPNWAALA